MTTKHDCPWCRERKLMGPCPAHAPKADRSRGIRSWELWRATTFAQVLICMYSESLGKSVWHIAFVDVAKNYYAQLTRDAARAIMEKLKRHGAVLVDIDPRASANTKVWN